MINEVETDQFVSNEGKTLPSKRTERSSTWWNQGYRSQQVICRIIESSYFHALVIFLVVVDTGLVIAEIMLDSFKNYYECEIRVHRSLRHHNERLKDRIEVAIEAVHFSSIGILLFFVVELLVRIYASGGEFWNIQRKKMVYFDALIVITSLAIDLVLLRGENKIVGHHLLLILIFRLWRFVRIVSSVSEGILDTQTKHKTHLNHQYLNAVRRLVEVITYKTDHLKKNDNANQNLQSVLGNFRRIDEQCRSAEERLGRNRRLPSSAVVMQFLKELEELGNRGDDSIPFEKPLAGVKHNAV